MKLKPLRMCLDQFLVILASDVAIYSGITKEELSRTEIARTAFGRVHLLLMDGYYCIEDKD